MNIFLRTYSIFLYSILKSSYFLIFFKINVEAMRNDNSITLFHDPPKPLAVWQDPFPMPKTFQRPISWSSKNFGQWCRNFTINIHRQCPEASPFHWFVCCGEHNVDCCVGIQTWAYVVFGSLILSAIIIFTFFIFLHFNLIFNFPDELSKEVSTRRNSTPTDQLINSSSTSCASSLSVIVNQPPSSTALLFGSNVECNKDPKNLVKPVNMQNL